MLRLPTFLSTVSLISVLIFSMFLSAAANRNRSKTFEILAAKMTSAVDEKRMPADVRTEFPAETQEVHCWFSWKGMEGNLQVIAQWYFVSSSIPILILDYPLNLTRVADHGIVSLKMPSGKNFPPGAYRLDFKIKDRAVKSLSFKVLPDSR